MYFPLLPELEKIILLFFMQEFLQGICSLLLNKFGMNAHTNLGRRQRTKKNEVGKCIPPTSWSLPVGLGGVVATKSCKVDLPALLAALI
jgi:hypothetical protein